MTAQVTNQLHFQSNAKTILSFLKSKAEPGESPLSISLNSIKKLPQQLHLPMQSFLVGLSSQNMGLPEFKDNVLHVVMKEIKEGKKLEKSTKSELLQTVRKLQGSLEPSDLKLLNKAVENYESTGYFCHRDWCMTNWGTIEDILSADESTFNDDTTCIEFETLYTPPLTALKILADTFPSVRFKLLYKYSFEDSWTNMEIFPITPFGY